VVEAEQPWNAVYVKETFQLDAMRDHHLDLDLLLLNVNQPLFASDFI